MQRWTQKSIPMQRNRACKAPGSGTSVCSSNTKITQYEWRIMGNGEMIKDEVREVIVKSHKGFVKHVKKLELYSKSNGDSWKSFIQGSDII